MRPFFSFYGGKWRAAPLYPAPTHDTIVEPFAGSAGYSMRHAYRNVVLVEKDERIAGIWMYLTRVSEAEIRQLPDVRDHTDELDVCEEARNLIGFWLNRGASSPRPRPGSWMRQGTHARSFWGPVARERIASQLHRIRHWRIICGDYTAAPDVPATWFIDPPYQLAGRHYRCHAVNYAHLGGWCRARPGQVIACENVGAQWLPFRPLAEVKARKGTTHEAVWLSDGLGQPSLF